jgi:hypothetical protein
VVTTTFGLFVGKQNGNTFPVAIMLVVFFGLTMTSATLIGALDRDAAEATSDKNPKAFLPLRQLQENETTQCVMSVDIFHSENCVGPINVDAPIHREIALFKVTNQEYDQGNETCKATFAANSRSYEDSQNWGVNLGAGEYTGPCWVELLPNTVHFDGLCSTTSRVGPRDVSYVLKSKN